jgi:transcriptional regulator
MKARRSSASKHNVSATTRIKSKWKVSQNRPESDRRGVRDGLREQGTQAEAMADLVARYGGLNEH